LDEKNKFWKLRNNGSIAGYIERVKIGIIVAISVRGMIIYQNEQNTRMGILNPAEKFRNIFSFTNTNIKKSITKVLKNLNI
jgi:hypothetical protein